MAASLFKGNSTLVIRLFSCVDVCATKFVEAGPILDTRKFLIMKSQEHKHMQALVHVLPHTQSTAVRM